MKDRERGREYVCDRECEKEIYGMRERERGREEWLTVKRQFSRN